MKFNDEMDHSCAYGKSSKSEGGRWEIAIAPRIFGAAVQLAMVGDFGATLTYCCGQDAASFVYCIQGIKNILKDVDENTHYRDIQALFPIQEIKPIIADPNLYQFFYRAFVGETVRNQYAFSLPQDYCKQRVVFADTVEEAIEAMKHIAQYKSLSCEGIEPVLVKGQ